MNVGQCTGANSTLNKGATGLPLRANAVVGHEEGRGRGGREKKREETAFCASRGDDAQKAVSFMKSLSLSPLLNGLPQRWRAVAGRWRPYLKCCWRRFTAQTGVNVGSGGTGTKP